MCQNNLVSENNYDGACYDAHFDVYASELYGYLYKEVDHSLMVTCGQWDCNYIQFNLTNLAVSTVNCNGKR